MDQNLGNTLVEDIENIFVCLSVGIKPQRRSSSPPTSDPRLHGFSDGAIVPLEAHQVHNVQNAPDGVGLSCPGRTVDEREGTPVAISW